MEPRISPSTFRWSVQAGLGIVLIVLLAIHLVVNHWVAPQGLLTYADVIRYYDVPGIALMEILFLTVVTAHCLIGVHSVLLDLAFSTSRMKALTWALIILGLVIVGFGIRLTWIVSSLYVG